MVFSAHNVTNSPNVSPSKSPPSAIISPTPIISPLVSQKEQQLCSHLKGVIQSAQTINGSPVQCQVGFYIEGYTSEDGAFVLFDTSGNVVPNPCADYAWDKAHNVTEGSPCVAPPEPISTAKADCKSGKNLSPTAAASLPDAPPYYWNTEVAICTYKPITSYVAVSSS
ncbi:MAG: hypothetical protein ACREF5_01565 [Candidatus Saccharimonadales bacterium]